MRYSLIAILVALGATQIAHGQTRLGEETVVIFATVEQGKKVLGQRDDFVKRLSPFDRAARMKTDKAVSEKEFLEFVKRSVLPWTKREKAEFGVVLGWVRFKLADFSLPLPKTIYAIKTTGDEEGGAAYTRGNAIVFPQSILTGSRRQRERLIVHELFHVLSRNSPKLRERLYGAIGFHKCNEIELPATLASRKITNPDAPINDHYSRVSLNGEAVLVVPVLFSRTEAYDVQAGGAFFDYLEFRLLIVEKDADKKTLSPVYDGQEPMLVDVGDVSEFHEQIGKNTNYIIHPEEILADNFVLLVLGEEEVRSKEILDEIGNILSKHTGVR